LAYEAPTIKTSRQSDDIRHQLWFLHDKRLRRHEAILAKGMRGFFAAQLTRTIDGIRGLTSDGRMMSRIGHIIVIKAEGDIPPGSQYSFLDKLAENDKLKAEMRPAMARVIEAAGVAALEEVSTGVAFDLMNGEVANAIELFQNRLVKVNDTTFAEIQNILTDAYRSGDTLADVERRIRETFNYFSKVRSVRVARTEGNGLVNMGTELAYEQGGVDEKEWLSTRDSHVRDTHGAADGQRVGVREKFNIGGWPLSAPGDPSGPAREVINCRCTIIPY
jgi:SPP1 gp7 family putative phage head morphogenesis protein